MANLNAPYGLSPIRTIGSDKYNAQVSRYYIPSTDSNAYYIGDLVLSTAAADANGVSGVIKATAGTETYRGVVVGVEVANVNSISLAGPALQLEYTGIPATKLHEYYVYVQDDPSTLYRAQGDATTTLQVAASANKNCSFTIAAGATLTSDSGTVINSSTIATTATLSGKLVGLLQIANSANAFGAYAQWQVKLNQHEFQGNTAGV